MKSKEVIFLERRLFEETTLQTVKRDLENFETLSNGETYLYETITHHIEELIKNWKMVGHMQKYNPNLERN